MKGKPNVVHSWLLILVSMFLFSCAGMRTFQGNMAEARDRDKKAFVEKTDGQIVEANEAVLRTPLFKKAAIELDKNTRINLKDIVAYQNDQAYYRRIEGDFVPRIKKGNINVYQQISTYQEYNPSSMSRGGYGGWRTRTKIVLFLQKGDNEVAETMTPSVVKKYVQDYAPALEFMDLYEYNARKAKMWSWINTGAVLGSLFLATQGINSEGQVNAAGYAAVGLFFGGIINGFVNKSRKVKNVKNLELAIDAYNRQAFKDIRRK